MNTKQLWSVFYVLELILSILLWMLGYCVNLLIGYTLLKKKLFKSPSNRLVLNLLLASLIFNTFVSPFSILLFIFQSSIWNFGTFWCTLTGFLSTLTHTVSISTIAFIAMDRYVVIVKPLKFAHLSTKFKSSMMIVIAWAIGLSLGLFPLFFNIAWFEFIEAQRACVLITKKSLLFTTLYLLLSFGIPLLIVVFCYSAIFKVAWTKRNKINICLENVGYCKSPYGGLLAPSKSLWCCSLTGFSLKLNRRSGTLQRKISTNNFWNLQARSPIKSIFTLVSIVGFFLIISLPDAVRTLECLISGSSSQIGHTISYWASNLGYFSHPFLYGLLNRSIRKELYKIFNIHQTGSTGLRVRKRHVTTLPKIPERRISMPEMTNSSDPSSNNRRTSEPINFESYQRLRKRRLTTEYLLKEKERRTLEKNPMIIITPPIQ